MREEKLKSFYKEIGVFETPLHTNCKNYIKCWENLSAKQPHGDRSKIYLPYIGNKYNETKILVIGINMNNYGGIDAAHYLLHTAMDELAKGKKKLFSNETYKGSMLFYQTYKYASILCKSLIPEFNERLNNPLEYIAFTNHIKCSPDDGKNECTKEKILIVNQVLQCGEL